MIKNVLFLGLLFNSILINAQLLDIYFADWIIDRVETLDSTEIYGDLSFSRMKIKPYAKIDLYRDPLDEFDRFKYSCIYSIVDSSFKIKCDSIMQFKIEKITDNELILKRYNERYFFKKMLIQEHTGIFSKNDYKVVGKDTTSFGYIPTFDGDIVKYFSIDEKSKESILVSASFILKKNNVIDSIDVISSGLDSLLTNKVKNMIQKSQKKWSPASTLKYKKVDSKIFIYILVSSGDLSNLSDFNFYDKGASIFSKAVEYQTKNQYLSAEPLYSEYILLYKYLIYNTYYVGRGALPGYVENLNNGLINRAALRISTGRIDEGCQDLRLVEGNKKDAEEAKKYIKEYCK